MQKTHENNITSTLNIIKDEPKQEGLQIKPKEEEEEYESEEGEQDEEAKQIELAIKRSLEEQNQNVIEIN